MFQITKKWTRNFTLASRNNRRCYTNQRHAIPPSNHLIPPHSLQSTLTMHHKKKHVRYSEAKRTDTSAAPAVGLSVDSWSLLSRLTVMCRLLRALDGADACVQACTNGSVVTHKVWGITLTSGADDRAQMLRELRLTSFLLLMIEVNITDCH
jgi:Tfp pilus assembly protein PilV